MIYPVCRHSAKESLPEIGPEPTRESGRLIGAPQRHMAVYLLELGGEDDAFAAREAESAATGVRPIAPGLAVARGIAPERVRGLAYTHRASGLLGRTDATSRAHRRYSRPPRSSATMDQSLSAQRMSTARRASIPNAPNANSGACSSNAAFRLISTIRIIFCVRCFRPVQSAAPTPKANRTPSVRSAGSPPRASAISGRAHRQTSPSSSPAAWTRCSLAPSPTSPAHAQARQFSIPCVAPAACSSRLVSSART